MTQLPKPRDSEYDNFGHALRHYRMTIAERLRQSNPGLLVVQASALDLIRCLRSQGYHISPAAYSAIENGESLPRDPEEFIDKVAKCLVIEPKSEQWWTLTLYAVHGLMAQKLGLDTANRVVSLNKEDISEHTKKNREPNMSN